MAFEELGPTFVKLGQLLATRPNLIPPDFVEEFKKFHDDVAPLPFSEIRLTLEAELGPLDRIFQYIDETPLAAASIAQVHSAQLKTGEDVVIKVQRPGIITTIQNDLGVLYVLATLLERYVSESRPFNPQAVVDEFFKTLELETDFLVEANNIRRIAANFSGDAVIKIPKVYTEFITSRVLILEKIKGVRLSDSKALTSTGIDRQKVVGAGLKAFFRMVFNHGIFHGDLHAGNIFILPDDKIGLVDFGVVGHTSQKTRDSIANMLVGLATEDYEMMAYEYLELAPYNKQVDYEQFTRDIRDLLAPYYGMTFKSVNFGKLLMDTTYVAARHQIIMPSELMLFFKAIVTVEGMGRTIIQDFDPLAYCLEFANEIVKSKYDPNRLLKDATKVLHDSSSLLYTLPRQIKQFLRRLNSRDFSIDLEIKELTEIKKSIEVTGTLIYLGLVIGSIIIAATMALNFNRGPEIYGIPVLSLTGYTVAFILGLVAFYNHLKK